MGWYRVSSNFGSSVVVRAENREEAIKQVWNALEELSRGAVEGLRRGSFVVSEVALAVPEEACHGLELCALVYAAPSRRRPPLLDALYEPQAPPS